MVEKENHTTGKSDLAALSCCAGWSKTQYFVASAKHCSITMWKCLMRVLQLYCIVLNTPPQTPHKAHAVGNDSCLILETVKPLFPCKGFKVRRRSLLSSLPGSGLEMSIEDRNQIVM